MKNKTTIIIVLVIIALAAAYYFFIYKKKDVTPEKSSFAGLAKKPLCGCPKVFNQNTNTFKNTGIPCSSGDVNSGTWHVNGTTKNVLQVVILNETN